jgi:NAD(P)H-hydrate epimerase
MLSVDELAELLRTTGERHHVAFAASDGADAEWALWYAAHLQALIWGRIDPPPTRSQLCRLLLEAEDAARASETGEPWPTAYARFLMERLPGG